MSDKRTFPRLRRRLKLELAGLVLGYTVDVSAGGFQVEHLKPMPKGMLAGRLIAPEGQFAFTGLLAWNEAGVPTSGIKSRSGIRLSGIDPAYYAWLAQTARSG